MLDSLELARLSRISALRMVSRARAAHIGSSLSVIDILAVLYSPGGASTDPKSPDSPGRDIVILSKGHAAAAMYAVLANAGFFDLDLLDHYCDDGAKLNGHVTSHGVPGVEFSTGSLGHGLPYGVGVALGASATDRRVFVVLSDGECDEGSNWEAALFASHHALKNLTVLIDRNGLQSLGSTEDTIRLEPLAAKWEAFGWSVLEVDGHDHDALRTSIRNVQQFANPSVIICKTIKGKGVSFMEDSVLWHYKSPSTEQLSDAVTSLGGLNA